MTTKYQVPDEDEKRILLGNGIDPSNMVVESRSEGSILLLNHETRDQIYITQGDRKWSSYQTHEKKGGFDMSNSKYITVSVEILIDTESDLYNRLTRLSEVQKSTFGETVEQVVTPGIWRHMEDYCSYYEERPLIREQR